MTVKELYEWACKNGIENYDIVVLDGFQEDSFDYVDEDIIKVNKEENYILLPPVY